MRDPYGRLVNFSYDLQDNLTLVVDMEGNPFGYTYDSDVRVNKLTTVQGQWVYESNDYDPNNHLAPAVKSVKVTDPTGEKEMYIWRDPTARINSLIQLQYIRRGSAADLQASQTTTSASTTVIGGRGKMDYDYAPDGTSTRYEYDPATGQPSAITIGISAATPQGQTTRYTYNFMGQPTSVTNPRGFTTRFNYAPNGIDLLNVVDAQNRTIVAYTYNSFHQPTTVTLNPGDQSYTTYIAYKPWGVVSDMTNALEEMTIFHYDSPSDTTTLSGTKRLLSVTRPNDLGTPVTLAAFSYDARGHVQTVNDAYGFSQNFAFTQKYTYNDLDKLTQVEYQDGSTTKTEYACCNLPGVSQDRAGRKTYSDYDVMKRLARTQNALGSTVQTDYDSNGNLSEITSENGSPTHFTYDRRDRLTRKSYAGGTWDGYTYDDRGNVASYRDARNVVTRYLYDLNDNLTKIDYATTPDVTWVYDILDRPTQITDATGTTTYGYDTLSRLISVDGPVAGATDAVSYSYDRLSRRLSMKVNGTDAVTYSYDALGRLESLTAPTGQFTYEYVGGTSLVSKVTSPNATKALYGYDDLQRLEQVENLTGAGANISKYRYVYDSTTKRDVRTKVEKTIGGAALKTINYGYDNIDQLTSEVSSETPPTLQNTYEYGPSRNRTVNKIKGGSTVAGGITQTYARNPLNQVVTQTRAVNTGGTVATTNIAWTYGPRGGLTGGESDNPSETQYVLYGYDEGSRLSSVLTRLKSNDANVHQSLFVYDGLNRRTRVIEQNWNGTAWVTESDTRFIYDGMEVVQERDTATNAIKVKYVTNGAIGGMLSRQVMNGAVVQKQHFYHSDGLGSVVQMTNGAQVVEASYDYDAFGTSISESGVEASLQPYRFNGKWRHRYSALYDYGYRFYSPSFGNWMNRDPIEEAGGINLYNFVGNNPVSNFDPYGLDWLDNASNFSAGMGDNLSFGATGLVRSWMGTDEFVNPCSGWYSGGQWAGTGVSLALGGASLAKSAATTGSLRFSQITASPFFSKEGSMAGRSIASVANDLRAGILKTADLPVEYLMRDGNRLLINTRSSLALKQANIAETSWNLISRTGVESAEAAMTERLLHNGLSSMGTNVLRITGAGKWASVLRP